MMTKKKFIYVGLFFFLGLCFFSGYHILKILVEDHQNEKNMTVVQEIYFAEQENKQESIRLPSSEARNSFEALRDVNEDINGWLTIDGTAVDYPILQTTDNEFYLTHNYKGENYSAGSIFKDFRNTNEFINKNTIIYGHYVNNGTMFGGLEKFKEATFFNQHPSFEYDTLLMSYDVQIFSIYQTTDQDNYLQTDFESDEEYLDYLEVAKNKSMYKKDISITKEDRILTLSTCDQRFDLNGGRLVIHGKLVMR